MAFGTWTMRKQLTAGFGGMALLMLVLTGLSWQAASEASDAFDHYVSGINARAEEAQHFGSAADRRAIAARNLVLASQPQDMEREKQAAEKAHQAVQEHLGQLKSLMASATDASDTARKLVADLEAIERRYGPVALSIVELAANGKRDEAIAKINAECRPLLKELLAKEDEYVEYTMRREHEMKKASATRLSRQRITLLAASAAALLMALGAGLLITRSVMRQLGAEPSDLGTSAERVAGGDLSPLPGSTSAPQGSVLASLATMQANLANIVAQVREASDSIATGSTQIAAGSTDLSQRTEEQASALQQTAATMEELSATVRHNADNASQANQLAQGASQVASKGGQVFSQVVGTMREINQSSGKIVDIIGVIDSIAFQTNILALNAAVESARAGEQGRGFAVVASEVRALAQRSAQAAKEIKTLITDSVKQVEEGSTLVDHATHAMQDMVDSIRRVTDIMGEISAANAEQSTGVNTLGQAVSQIDQATQQNAALVEESAAAAQSLQMQAQLLVKSVSVFRLPGQSIDDAEAARPPVSAHAAPRSQQLPQVKSSPVTRKPAAGRLPMTPALATAAAGHADGDWESF